MVKILLIDENVSSLESIAQIYSDEGYNLILCSYGKEGFELAKSESPDIIIISNEISDISSKNLLGMIREDKKLYKMPIMVLKEKSSEDDMVELLDCGADDYISMPCAERVILSRSRALMRRYIHSEDVVIETNNLILSIKKREVYCSGERIELTIKEFDLLKLFVQNRGEVLTREELLEKVWGYDYFSETRTVDVHIRYLRKKLSKYFQDEKCIQTIRGVGYKFN